MYEVELEGIHDLDSEISLQISLVRRACERHDAFESDASSDNVETLLISNLLAHVHVSTLSYSAPVMAQGLSFGCNTLNVLKVFWVSLAFYEKVTGLCILPQLVR